MVLQLIPEHIQPFLPCLEKTLLTQGISLWWVVCIVPYARPKCLLWIYFSWPLQFDLVMEPPPAWANSRHSYDTATGCPVKWPLRNMCRNSILMKHHYPTLGCASDWMKKMKHYTDNYSDSSSVWNFCAHSPDVIPVVVLWDVGCFLAARTSPYMFDYPILICPTTLVSGYFKTMVNNNQYIGIPDLTIRI